MSQYLKNQDLLKEIKISKDNNQLTLLALDYIYLMTDRIGLEFRYRDKKDFEDCKSEAILNVLNYWRDFDENKSTNAFSYFTQMIKMGYAIGYNKIYRKKIKTISFNVLDNINNI